MQQFLFILLAEVLSLCDGFTVQGSSGPLVVPLGGSAVLPCFVDKLLSMEGLEVEWRRTDLETLVLLYPNGENRPEAQQQDYRDRAHFFTDYIKDGNFSLHLVNLRAQDEGQYTCKIYSQQDSGETVVQIHVSNVERLIVSGSNRSISAHVGEDVTLNCSVDSHVPPEQIEEVSWKKKDKDGDILVLLFQNNEALVDSADEQYKDRVEFFTDEIPKGNFSLRLKSVRTVDKGLYMCQVFAGGASANTTALLEQLGFSILHIMVLIFSIAASGSAFLLCFLVYCRSQRKVLRNEALLVFCPNMILFFAFILWGATEGSVYETVSCCVLYFTRPLMLFWAAPYLKDFPDIFRRWIDSSSIDVQLSVYTVLFYSVLFRRSWTTIIQYTEADKAMITVLFLLMILMCLIKVIKGLTSIALEKSSNVRTREQINNVLHGWELVSCRVLPLLQFTLLFYSFGAAKKGSDWLGKTLRLIIMLVVNAAVFVLFYLYFKTLESEEDWFALVWMACLVQVLWMIRFSFDYLEFPRVKIVYIFGAVVLVLVNSAGLMTELILQVVNGERTVGDLRIIVFPSECVFILIGLTVEIYTFSKAVCKQIKQNKAKRNKDAQRATELCEMNTLSASD